MKKAIQETLKICREKGVLSDYINERESAIVDILTRELEQRQRVSNIAKSMKISGRKKAIVDSLRTIMRIMNFSQSEAMECLEIPDENREYYSEAIKQSDVASPIQEAINNKCKHCKDSFSLLFDEEYQLNLYYLGCEKDGWKLGMCDVLRCLVQNMKLSLNEAMNFLGIPNEERPNYCKAIEKGDTKDLLDYDEEDDVS
ncbi:MAG: hypothetical protein J6A01_03220 [Proteobacteria bacterium]|nr:hypothetical protein [Pseudomonadota bacterium]